MVGCIHAIADDKNMFPHKGVLPIAMGLIVTAIGTSFAFNCGYAINCARDLGPRLFTVIAGWGLEPLRFVFSLGITCCTFTSLSTKNREFHNMTFVL